MGPDLGLRPWSELAGDALLVAFGSPAESRLRRREASHRHAVRGAAHVVEPDLVEERDRVRIAAVLTADADLQAGPRCASLFDSGAHELADARHIESLERVRGEDPTLDVVEEEAALGVVAAVPECHLRQVVGAEAEEIG